MKREGKHHGNAKSHPNKTARFVEKLPNNSGKIEEARAADQAELLQLHRQTKPTNGSRFTGKCKKPRCKSCHYHPVTKSKDKAKGAYKLKSCDVALNHRLVSWRVVGDDLGVLDYKGASASAVLKDLAGSIYSSNYSCDDSNEVHDRAPEVGYDDVDNNLNNFNNSSYGYYKGGSFNNSIDNNSTDFVDHHEDEILQQRIISTLLNNSAANCKTKATDNSIDQFIGFGNLFDESEKDPTSDFIGFGGLFDEIEPEDVAEKQPDDSETEEGDEEEEGDDMGFYIVGVAYEFSDGEDWLVVDEM